MRLRRSPKKGESQHLELGESWESIGRELGEAWESVAFEGERPLTRLLVGEVSQQGASGQSVGNWVEPEQLGQSISVWQLERKTSRSRRHLLRVGISSPLDQKDDGSGHVKTGCWQKMLDNVGLIGRTGTDACERIFLF